MVEAYKSNSQFILILMFMYVIGVWFDPLIYIVFPLMYGLYGLKGHYIELIVMAVWILILSDYIPVKGATHADLKFAKDLKPIVPLFLFGFYFRNRSDFPPVSRVFIRFIPFFIAAFVALQYSLKIDVGLKKYLSYILMYFSIPMYVNYLHKEYGEYFWKTLFTFIIGMLIIGLILGVAVPQIGVLTGGRFKGIFGNPNGLGIFLNLIFIFWTLLKEFKNYKLYKRRK